MLTLRSVDIEGALILPSEQATAKVLVREVSLN